MKTSERHALNALIMDQRRQIAGLRAALAATCEENIPNATTRRAVAPTADPTTPPLQQGAPRGLSTEQP